MARRLLTHPLGSGVRAWGAAATGRHGAATVRCLGCRSRAIARLQRLRRPACLQVHGPRLKSRSCRTAKGTGRRVSRATGSALPRGTGKVGIPTWLPISHTQPTNDDSASKRAQFDQKLASWARRRAASFIRRNYRLPALENHHVERPGRRQREDECPELAAAPPREQPPPRGPTLPPQRRAHKSGAVLLRPCGRSPRGSSTRSSPLIREGPTDYILLCSGTRALPAARRQLPPHQDPREAPAPHAALPRHHLRQLPGAHAARPGASVRHLQPALL